MGQGNGQAGGGISPISREDAPALKDIFALVEGAMGFVPNSMLTMAKKPGLVEAFAGLGAQVQVASSLPPDLVQMIAYMASRSAGCRYCQAHTHHQASRAGVSEEKLAAIWSYETSDLFSEAERAALRVAQLAAQVPNAVAPEDMAALQSHFSEEQVIDIVAVISFFGFLNRWNDTMATALEDGPTAHASSHLAADGWSAGKHAR